MKQRIRIQNKDKTARIFLPISSFADLIAHMKDHGGKTVCMWKRRTVCPVVRLRRRFIVF